MALKPDRISVLGNTDISYFMNEVAERGIVVVHNTSGSGAAMDDPNATVVIPTSDSGNFPAGLLLNDVVNLDLTRQHINWHKDEVQLGGKVTLLRQGQVTTNMIVTGETPSAGDPLYYDTDGELTATEGNSPQIGRFLSSVDADGYAKIEVNIT